MNGKRSAAGVSATIDPERGGRITLGRVGVDLPPGFGPGSRPLEVNLAIRDTLPESPYRKLYSVFDLEATEWAQLSDGAHTEHRIEWLNKPITLEIDYSDIQTDGPVVISYWDQRLGHWWHLPTEIDAGRKVARAQTWHFSAYGLGDDVNSPTPAQTLESFQTSLLTGAATASYTIDVPPGTGGLTPKITLTYSSQLVDDMNETWAQVGTNGLGNTEGDNSTNALQASFVRLGWNLELGAIFRRDDDTYYLQLEGSSYELILIDDSDQNDKRLRTEDEQFWLIRRRYQYSQHTSWYYWQIRTNDGTEYRFGFNHDSDVGPH